VQGVETPSKLGSSRDDDEEGEDEEDGEIISSPHSLSSESLPLLGNLFKQQVGIPTSVCRVKRPQVDVGGGSIPPS
jgi:hypothetical protein